MKPLLNSEFHSKRDVLPNAAQDEPAIRIQMDRNDWLVLLLLAVIWGGAFFFIDVAVKHVPPLTYVWLRVTIAAAAMWSYVALRGERVQLPRSVWGSIVLLAFLNNALPFTLFGWGQTHIASGLASILNSTTPIWGVVIAHLFTHDELMTPRKTLGVGLGFTGVATMIAPSLVSNVATNALAQIACVIAALSYALAAVWARRFRKQGISPLSVTTGQLSAAAVMMFPAAMMVDRPWLHQMPPLTAIGAITALALLCTAFGYVLYFRLIATSGATNALLVTLLVPPVAILLGGVILGETLSPNDFLGLLLIGLGLAAIDGRLLNRRVLSGRLRPRA